MSNNTKLLCLFLKAQKIDKSSERGYAMVVVSILSIIMFSILSASLVFSNLAKSRTDAFVDGQSAFAVAEAGLNKRAIEVSKKIQSSAGLEGVPLTAIPSEALATCFDRGIPADGSDESDRTGTNDFECANYRFQSNNNAANVTSSGNISLSSNEQNPNTYVAYTVVVEDRSKYVDGMPAFTRIAPGETYSGLNAAEYKYVVHATGRKPIALSQGSTLPVYTPEQTAAKNRQSLSLPAETGDAALIVAYDTATAQATAAATAARNAARDSSNNTSLSMTFTNRVIPLFQFGIFYNGDLELNSTSPMQISGRVHSNANIYVQPTGLNDPTEPQSVTTFLSNVSAAGNIYNRVDAWTEGASRTGITKVLLTGTSCAIGTCQDLPAYDAGTTTPLTVAQISAFGGKITGGTNTAADKLEIPPISFTRKRNYADNTIGEYYAKADMRLEMVPDRDVTSKASTPAWTRDTTIIPFNFTAITTRGTGVCTTATPTAGNDPAATYVDPDRDNRSRLKCTVLTKGRLQSLRQPVMVLTNINQNSFTTTKTNAEIRTIERTTLGAPPQLPEPKIFGSGLSTTANIPAVKQKILRALQVALVSTSTPVRFERLDNPFNTGVYAAGTPDEPFKTAFSYLIDRITELSELDRFNLLQSSPNQIAALMDAWFLPAPIQRLERPTTDTNNTAAAENPRKSGFYDRREQRWITMLQANIASLSVWNRDGIYVDPTDATLTTGYVANNTLRNTAFSNANTFDATHALDDSVAFNSENGTDGLVFDRAAADATKPEGSLQYLGLGSSDKTEGGLVFHASVKDDLDGSGTIVAANDITVITSDNSQRILKKNSDNTNFTDSDSNVVVLDYYRTYPSQTVSRQSPFGFAFNGGNYLPSPLLLSSDQSVYVQGNFNNNQSNGSLPNSAPNTPSPDRLPAAIVADTITVLSNECVSTNIGDPNSLLVPFGQLKCGLPPTINGAPNNSPNTVGSSMAINAAFVANTPTSVGNLGTGRGFASTTKSYSGGVNNYMRLLEDWQSGGGYALHYAGSLISFREPLEYSGLYRSGGTDTSDSTDYSYYNVPFRNFNYDPNFDNIMKLPPLTPKVTNVKQRNFVRGY
jgi:hypothetical protein